MIIDKVELWSNDSYKIVIENNVDEQRTEMGVGDWCLTFTRKQDVEDHIALLQKALEVWGYE